MTFCVVNKLKPSLFYSVFRLRRNHSTSYRALLCSYSSNLQILKENNNLPPAALLSHSLENLYCHKLMEERSNYSVFKLSSAEKVICGEDLVSLKKVDSFENISASDLVKAFKICSFEALNQPCFPLSNEQHRDLRSAVKKKCNDFTDVELGEVILYSSIWPMSESSRQKEFYEFWKALDEACCRRWKNWSFDKVLYFIDLWYTLKLIKFSDFVYNSLSFVSRKSSKLTPYNVVQALFYLNALRAAHKGIEMINLEDKLERHIKELSLAEIGIAALGFFKTKKHLQSQELIVKIMNHVKREIETVPEITLVSIYKCLRLSLPLTMWKKISGYLDCVLPEMDRLSLSGCVNIALLAGPSNTVHQPSCAIVSQRLVDSISTARIKEMERILFLLSSIDFEPSTSVPICEAVITEISRPSRQEEIQKFGRSFFSLLHYLVLRGHYPYDLISQALDMDFIHRVYGKNRFNFGYSLLFIDTSVEVACPDYKGNRLLTEVRNYMSKVHSNYLPDEAYKMSKHAQFTHDVMTSLQSLLGVDCVKYSYTLPHYVRPDIVYQTDAAGKILKLPEEFVSREDFTGLVYPPPNGNKWHSVVLGSKNSFCCNTLQPNGQLRFKLNSISKLGYEPHLVSIYDWPQNGPQDEKMSHLKNFLCL